MYRIVEAIYKKRPHRLYGVLLQHGNARPHIANMISFLGSLPPAGGNVIISFSPTFLQQGLRILFKSPAPPPLLLAVSFKFSTCYSCYPSSFIVSAGGIVITDFSPVYFQQGFGFWFLVILLTIQTLSWEVLPHPPHSPSMALSNFHPFQLLSNNIRRFIQYVEVRIWLYKFF